MYDHPSLSQDGTACSLTRRLALPPETQYHHGVRTPQSLTACIAELPELQALLQPLPLPDRSLMTI